MTPQRHSPALRSDRLAVAPGAHVKVVQRMLGHKSAAMALDTYADLFDGDPDDVAERMNERGQASTVRALSALGFSA